MSDQEKTLFEFQQFRWTSYRSDVIIPKCLMENVGHDKGQASSSRKTCVYHLIYEAFGSLSPKQDYGAAKEVVAEQVSGLPSISWVVGAILSQARRFSSHLFTGFYKINQ